MVRQCRKQSLKNDVSIGFSKNICHMQTGRGHRSHRTTWTQWTRLQSYKILRKTLAMFGIGSGLNSAFWILTSSDAVLVKCWPVSHWNVWHVANTGQHNSYIIYASLCAFCREVVPTKPFTNTALYCIPQNDAWIWTNPPCYKMGWGFLWWIKSQCRSLMVTTKWLCVPIL